MTYLITGLFLTVGLVVVAASGDIAYTIAAATLCIVNAINGLREGK